MATTVGVVIKNGKVSIFGETLGTINFPAIVNFKKSATTDLGSNDGGEGVVTGYIEMLNTVTPIPHLKPFLTLTYNNDIPKFYYSFKLNNLQYTVDTETILLRLLKQIKEIISGSEDMKVALAFPQGYSQECQEGYKNLAKNIGLNIVAVIKDLDGCAAACQNAKVVEIDEFFAIIDITPLSVNIGVYKNGKNKIKMDEFFKDEKITEEMFLNAKLKFFDDILNEAKQGRSNIRNDNFHHPFENYVEAILKCYHTVCDSKQISRIILNCDPILRECFKQKFHQLKFIIVKDFESLIAKGIINAANNHHSDAYATPPIPHPNAIPSIPHPRNQNKQTQKIKAKLPLTRISVNRNKIINNSSSSSDSDDE